MRKRTVFLFMLLLVGMVGVFGQTGPDFFELVANGTPEQVQAALDAGANVNDRGTDGRTPLMWAAGNTTTPEVVTTLLAAGAGVNDRDNNDRTPLMYAAAHTTTPEVIRTLLEAGANVNDHDKTFGMTPLMWAAAGATTPEVITTLLAAGAGVNDRDMYDDTPLMHAVIYTIPGNPRFMTLGVGFPKAKAPEVITTLLAAGAGVNDRNGAGMTPLMWAASYATAPGVITALLDAGANVNDCDEYGKTPLMHAAESTKTPEVVMILLVAGADEKMKSNEGKTAFDYAKWNYHIKETYAYWALNNAQ